VEISQQIKSVEISQQIKSVEISKGGSAKKERQNLIKGKKKIHGMRDFCPFCFFCARHKHERLSPECHLKLKN
jgi:hypothetical protein